MAYKRSSSDTRKETTKNAKRRRLVGVTYVALTTLCACAERAPDVRVTDPEACFITGESPNSYPIPSVEITRRLGEVANAIEPRVEVIECPGTGVNRSDIGSILSVGLAQTEGQSSDVGEYIGERGKSICVVYAIPKKEGAAREQIFVRTNKALAFCAQDITARGV